MKSRDSVVVAVGARLLDDNSTIPASLVYEPSAPYAVTVRFDLGAGDTLDWVLARELLEEGLDRPAGLGDARLAPIRHNGVGYVELWLISPSGQARFGLPWETVRTFLRRAAALVPPGTESSYLDWGELDRMRPRGAQADGTGV
ncbi:MAG: SsgA family sporulation/cell division regulator [Frankia sp.]|nr:SsgA family sporulation/cell division regulator [Frankia sp.]